jgi:large subunit ribosomal protein L2
MFIGLKDNFNNNSNGSRHKKQILKSSLSKNPSLVKNLRVLLKNHAGRAASGQISIRHKGAGTKQKIFKTNSLFKHNLSITISVNLDLKKTAFIGLHFDLKQKKFWNSIASRNLCSGALINNSIFTRKVHSSFSGHIRNFPTGTLVFNVSSNKNNLCYAKSAGVFCMLLQKSNKNIFVRLPSGKIVSLKKNAIATIGKVSNKIKRLCIIGKAGYNRQKNKRPSVRGVAMNPVDHPHGGNTSIGIHPKTPWGFPATKKSLKKNVKI